VTSTVTLRGRRGTYGTGLGSGGALESPAVVVAVGVAGKALGDIEWHLVTSTVTLRGRRGTYGTGLALVARLGLPRLLWLLAWQAWRLVTSTVTLRGRRPSLCVAGVALMALDWLWWRA